MYNVYEPDEYELVATTQDHGRYGGSGSLTYKLRPPEEIARRRAERREREENEILRKADEIRARRASA